MWKIKQYYLQHKSLTLVGVLYALVCIVASLLEVNKGAHFERYTHYNNYLIFRASFWHILDGLNLYVLHPKDQFDLYKYSPTFALLMAPFAMIPKVPGLILWNLLNGMTLWAGIRSIPRISDKVKVWILLFSLLEMLTSIQNAQSNALIAGMLVLGLSSLLKGKPIEAALYFVGSAYIKIFSIVGALLGLVFRKQGRFILACMVVTVLLAFLPAIIIGGEELLWQYGNWLEMLKQDKATSVGLSVAGWLQTWFGIDTGSGIYILVFGAISLLAPLLRFDRYIEAGYRIQYLALIMIWLVIFNHKAESPTFVIAVVGIALWLFTLPKWQWWHYTLAALVLIFTSLSPTDLFPAPIRKAWVIPYVLKVVPCILAYALLWLELMFQKTGLARLKSVTPTPEPLPLT